jgi:hypothetical protein
VYENAWSVTLKAFASSSPGLSFGNPVEHGLINRRRNSERVASRLTDSKAVATPYRVAKNLFARLLAQGFKTNPGLELANAFSVTRRTLSFHTLSTALGSRFCTL